MLLEVLLEGRVTSRQRGAEIGACRRVECNFRPPSIHAMPCRIGSVRKKASAFLSEVTTSANASTVLGNAR
jgi:hypothetical protein